MVDSVSPLGLEATRAAYSQCSEWLEALVQYLQANRDYLLDAVKSRLPGVVMHAPQRHLSGVAGLQRPGAWTTRSSSSLNRPRSV